MRLLRFFSAFLLIASPAFAAAVSVASYSYLNPPHSSYDDSGGELTDGVDSIPVWPVMLDHLPLVGWRVSDPAIRFDFVTATTLTDVTLWFADSNGAAGVSMPSEVIVSTTTGFSQNFLVPDPDGSGTTVPVTFSGFAVETNHAIVTIKWASEWTMLSEATFASTIPEPSSTALWVAAALGLAATGSRRQRR